MEIHGFIREVRPYSKRKKKKSRKKFFIDGWVLNN